ncbi:glycoside hydrolase family 130 protein [Anaerobranca gottschalkii]|uniref:Predicted glycosyl hydrolase, GH43/DUF377 family n=1 Tax=Anaerobranca gottschalkii DSM 13577 TaxID=1120990 RepID=A0A1H9YIM5_9FIRM|nr:glycoside hydrolase family 130 protein [Anaerobranca gottschalkii]SES68423.1 Predicted glycosyl hydrolase, GH43/DUF377 family [Anaerobranca gottschalkii DSM 13577]
MKTNRYKGNPIITPKDIKPHREDFEVIGVFNPGVAIYNDEVILLLRVAERPICKNKEEFKAPVFNFPKGEIEILTLNINDESYDFTDSRVIKDNIKKDGSFKYLTSISYILKATSKDGKNFRIDEKPFIYPSNQYDVFGVEDPRITKIEDYYYIYFSVVSSKGVGVRLVKTKDFNVKEDCGIIFAPENKDVVIFPERINGKYYALHRPVPKCAGNPEIWIAESDNLIYWGNHKLLLELRENMWDNGRIGGGLVPIKTEKGWLELYHGASKNNRYCMGAVLLDLENPSKVLARSEKPILEPQEDYEINGFFNNVVFGCGAIVEGDLIKMYYGVADTSVAYVELSIKDILNSLR